MPGYDLKDFLLLGPEIFLALAGMVLLLAGVIGKGISHRGSAFFSVACLLATMGWLFYLRPEEAKVILAGQFVLDGYAFVWKLILLVATILTVVLSVRFIEEGGYRPAEYYALILLATDGMLFMASGYSLLSIWISLETMALASYILAGYFKREKRSNEAALKYFILGALSSGVLLYGISLIYGTTGTIRLDSLAAALPQAAAEQGLLLALGWLMLAAGLLFKVAAVPFHIWTPDVYVGAPTPVTGYLAAASKAASFAILARIFYEGLSVTDIDWQPVIAAVAVVSMIWGNIAALTQSNVKRMLAYSSIAHAGYVLVGVLAVSELGLWSIVYYMLAYVFITLGTFGAVILLERKEYAGETYADYAGLAARSPALAAMMTFFMLALTGIPPTGGFVGKLYLFGAAVEAGWSWVAVIGVLTSAISLYYYFGLVVYMYMREATDATPAPAPARAVMMAIGLCAVLTLALGIYPEPFVELAKSAAFRIP